MLSWLASCQQLHSGVRALPDPFGGHKKTVVEGNEVGNVAIIEAEALRLLVGVDSPFELGELHL
jgi:hypothetical protein